MLRYIFCLILMAALSCRGADDAPKIPEKPHFKIFLLIGQSNMAGRGVVEAEDKIPHPRVLALDKADAWAPAINPIHFDKPKIAGVGPGVSFGKTIAEARPEDTIGLLPCAVGGSSISQWEKGQAFYKEALRRANIALKQGTLAGILWHQGESDSAPDKAALYTERAKKLFAALRADLNAPDVPVIVGTLGDFKHADQINDALRGLATQIPHCACAEAKGLNHKGDNLHFDAPSAREFGRRYAAE